MIEKQMIRLMLNKKFYTQYKGTLSSTVFSGDVSSLYDTIQKAHDKYENDIKIDELYSLHTTIFNPALTRAAKEKFSELVEDIEFKIPDSFQSIYSNEKAMRWLSNNN